LAHDMPQQSLAELKWMLCVEGGHLAGDLRLGMIKGGRHQPPLAVGEKDATGVAQRLGDSSRGAIKRRRRVGGEVMHQRGERVGADWRPTGVAESRAFLAPQPLDLLAGLLKFTLALLQLRARAV